VVDRLRQRIGRLGAPEAFSLRIALITFPFAVAFAIGLDRPRLGGSLVAWLGIVLLAQLAVVLVALPLRLTILRAGERAARPLTTLLAFGLLGSLRGLTLNAVALEVGIADHIEWTSRIAGGFLAGAVIGGVTAYFTVASIEHRGILRRLLEQQASLTAARERETTLLAQVRRELGQLVDEQVIRPLRILADELRAATPGASLGAADRVDQLVEEHTRPVSALLLSLPDDTMITPGTIAADQATTTTWRRLRDSSALAARSRPLQPLIPALAIGIWGFGSIALGSTSARALIGAVAAVAVTVVLTALLDRQWYRVARLSDLICVLLAIAAISSAILAGIGTYVAVTGSLDPWKGITVLFLVVVATAAARLRALAAALQTEREALEHNLRSTVDELEWQVAHVRARVRAKREALARVVHGPVQATLISVGARLAAAERDGTLNDALLRSLADELDAALTAIAEPRAPRIEVAEVLGQFVRLWHGVVEIQLAIAPAAEDALAADPDAAATVVEIAREAILNAVRHAGSTTISIDVALDGTDVARVVAECDLTVQAPANPSGSGSVLLDRVTLSWHRTISERTVHLEARVPVVA
jgi:signal transduction histidine kinase